MLFLRTDTVYFVSFIHSYNLITADKNLLTAIESEIKHEEEQGDEVPDYITEYLKSSPFEITNKAGSDEITLTRKFGNEEYVKAFFGFFFWFFSHQFDTGQVAVRALHLHVHLFTTHIKGTRLTPCFVIHL